MVSTEVVERGACFGFSVRSPLPFTYLRTGRGDPLEVLEAEVPGGESERPLVVWEPEGGKNLAARLFSNGGRYRLWIEATGWFGVDPGAPRVDVPPGLDPVVREERLWSIPALLCFVARGDFPLHAAAVEVGDGAVLLAAPGQAGKTTLAGAFLAARHRVLAEDLCCCRIAAGPPVLFPGPAMLRARPDAYDRFGFPGTRLVGRERHRVHLAHEEALRGSADPVPVRAVVFLHAGGGEPALVRVPAEQALPDLWALSFKLPTDEDRARCFESAVDVARTVPIFRLVRPLTYDGLAGVAERIEEAVREG